MSQMGNQVSVVDCSHDTLHRDKEVAIKGYESLRPIIYTCGDCEAHILVEADAFRATAVGAGDELVMDDGANFGLRAEIVSGSNRAEDG